MIRKKVKIVNNKKVEDAILLSKVEKRHFKKGEFFVMKKDFLADLILNKNYNFLEIKILAFFLKNIDFNNRIKSFKQKDIAEAIGSSQSRVSKTLKKLESENIIYYKNNDYYFSDQFVKYASDNQ